MKMAIRIACFFSFLACCGHFYLAKRAYQLSAGMAEKSAVCHINESINCDQALLSPYAKIFNFSISDFGFAFNLIVFLLLLFLLKFGLSQYWKNLLFYLSGLIALSSIGMAILSLIHSLYCPVCWSLYLFSFIVLACLFFAFRSDLSSPLVFFLKAIKEKSSYLVAGVILLCALFLHTSFVNAYGIKDKKEILSALFEDWQNEAPIQIPPHHLIQKGAKDSSIVLVEFADFLCPKCKRVQKPLKKFFQNFPDVTFYFFAYPIESNCSDSVSSSDFALRCELSKSLVCAQDKAWEFHDFFFEKQSDFISARGNKEKAQQLLEEIINRTQLDKSQFDLCMKEESTLEKVKISAESGSLVNVNATPTFFINGKKLFSYDPQLTVLNKIYQHLKFQ